MNYKTQISSDNTIKIIFENKYHCVLIPQKNNKYTLCISSQYGCPIDCKFCLTGKLGFKKNLNKEEIINQFKTAVEYLNLKDIKTKENSKGKNNIHMKISSIVFMGMGEPFLNYENVIKSCDFFNEFYEYPFQKITISTSGIIPKINDFTNINKKINLAISLHSPNQEIRNKIMPNLKHQEIKDLIKAANNYNSKNKTKVMIEYIMIKNLTDTDKDLDDLIELGLDKMTYFNLIPLNGTMELENKTYLPSNMKTCEKFKEKLIKNGYKCFIRHNMGEDIEAACGMLN